MKHWRLSSVSCLALTLVLGACGSSGKNATSTVAPTVTTASVAVKASPTAGAVSPTVPATATTAVTPSPTTVATATLAATTAATKAATSTPPAATATKVATTVPTEAATATSAAATSTGTTDTGAGATATAAAAAFDPDIMTKLNSAALTLEDLPEGWTQQPSVPTADSETDLCGKPAFERRAERLGGVEIDSQGTDNGPYVYQALTEFPADVAPDAWAAAIDAASCTEWTETDSSGAETTYHLTQLDDPGLGDESFGVELSFDVPELGTAVSDAYYIRVGNALTLVAWTALGPVDSQNLLDLATRAADKLTAASQ